MQSESVATKGECWGGWLSLGSWAGASMSCEVVVLYFARSAELAGVHTETISVTQQITSLQLWEEIVRRHSRLADIQDQVVFAVRQEYIPLGDQLLSLYSGDEIAIIPPISGG